MLSRKRRLRTTKQFENVFKNGRSLRVDGVVVKRVPNEQEHTRFGIVISKKVSKKATVRNKIRRTIRETIRMYEDSIIEGYDVVILVLPSFKPKDLKEAAPTIRLALQKTNIIST